jgi:hypothetical protein
MIYEGFLSNLPKTVSKCPKFGLFGAFFPNDHQNVLVKDQNIPVKE